MAKIFQDAIKIILSSYNTPFSYLSFAGPSLPSFGSCILHAGLAPESGCCNLSVQSCKAVGPLGECYCDRSCHFLGDCCLDIDALECFGKCVYISLIRIIMRLCNNIAV